MLLEIRRELQVNVSIVIHRHMLKAYYTCTCEPLKLRHVAFAASVNKRVGGKYFRLNSKVSINLIAASDLTNFFFQRSTAPRLSWSFRVQQRLQLKLLLQQLPSGYRLLGHRYYAISSWELVSCRSPIASGVSLACRIRSWINATRERRLPQRKIG